MFKKLVAVVPLGALAFAVLVILVVLGTVWFGEPQGMRARGLARQAAQEEPRPAQQAIAKEIRGIERIAERLEALAVKLPAEPWVGLILAADCTVWVDGQQGKGSGSPLIQKALSPRMEIGLVVRGGKVVSITAASSPRPMPWPKPLP